MRMSNFSYARESGFGVEASALYAEFMRGEITAREFFMDLIRIGGKTVRYEAGVAYVAVNNGIFVIDDYTVDIQ